jgi:hypothetical protein
MKKINKIIAGLFLITGLTYLTGCVKGNFDIPAPPTPGFSPNTTIAQLNQYYRNTIVPMGGFGPINQNMIIGGVVAANDQSGNIYKQIYIQDNTGGICISLNASELYTTYMVGQTVYIKCNGLSLGNYDSLPELGYNNAGAIGQIPELSISSYLFLSGYPQNPPTPKIATIPTFSRSEISTLIQLDSVHFEAASVGQPWALPTTAEGRYLDDIHGNAVEVYTSSSQYCPFATNLVPGGTGSVIAILSTYKGSWQLTLRDLSDLKGFN